jgi:hypothetical protein
VYNTDDTNVYARRVFVIAFDVDVVNEKQIPNSNESISKFTNTIINEKICILRELF